jgi:hypothetical protein
MGDLVTVQQQLATKAAADLATQQQQLQQQQQQWAPHQPQQIPGGYQVPQFRYGQPHPQARPAAAVRQQAPFVQTAYGAPSGSGYEADRRSNPDSGGGGSGRPGNAGGKPLFFLRARSQATGPNFPAAPAVLRPGRHGFWLRPDAKFRGESIPRGFSLQRRQLAAAAGRRGTAAHQVRGAPNPDPARGGVDGYLVDHELLAGPASRLGPGHIFFRPDR